MWWSIIHHHLRSWCFVLPCKQVQGTLLHVNYNHYILLLIVTLFILESFIDHLPVFGQFVIFEPSTGSSEIRRMCFSTLFSPDGVYEDTESYAFDLTLDVATTSVLVNQSSTEVFLLDEDGKKS